MSIVIREQNNFGNRAFYPVCENAKRFADIAGSKTLTVRTLELIEGLGYTVELQSSNVWQS